MSHVEATGAYRLTVFIDGALDLEEANRLLREVEGAVSANPPMQVLFDLSAVELIDSEARPVLIHIHQACIRSGARTAYVAITPLFRGTSLWVLHYTGDRKGRVVGNLLQAERWLHGAQSRHEQTVQWLRTLAPNLRGS